MLQNLKDAAITLILWTYFIFGFFLFFFFFYFIAFLFSKNRESSFQGLNHIYYRVFFFLIRTLIPSQGWDIGKEITTIRSSVVVCNHLSYLDPLLFISLFKRHKTIVKSRFFSMPIFGRVLNLSGYIPSSSEGKLGRILLKQMDSMDVFFKDGGNIFVFPEGTRSRDGRLGELHRGAFKIARLCSVPIQVMMIENTDKLFQPGRFRFNTCTRNRISVKHIGTIHADKTRSIDAHIGLVETLFESHQDDFSDLPNA